MLWAGTDDGRDAAGRDHRSGPAARHLSGDEGDPAAAEDDGVEPRTPGLTGVVGEGEVRGHVEVRQHRRARRQDDALETVDEVVRFLDGHESSTSPGKARRRGPSTMAASPG